MKNVNKKKPDPRDQARYILHAKHIMKCSQNQEIVLNRLLGKSVGIYTLNILRNIYDTKTLLGMLDIAIGAIVENELCSYCVNFYGNSNMCSQTDLCSEFIFDGLLKIYRKNKNY